MKEGGGGDNLAVTWQMPGDPPIAGVNLPIPGKYIVTLAEQLGATLAITEQPADVTYVLYPPTTGGTAQAWTEDFNTSNGGFTVDTPQPFDGPWMYNPANGTWHQDGQAPENGHANTSKLNSRNLQVASSGTVQLTLVHRYSFEGGFWDGGQVRISVNGGAYAAVPAAAFTQGGYNGAVLANSASQLAGQQAFVEDSPNYNSGPITSVANLGSFNAGDTITIQFMAASDTNTRGQFVPNWEIDQLEVSNVNPAQANPQFRVGVQANLPGSPSQAPAYQWQRNNGAGYFDIPGANGPSYSLTPLLADNGAKFRCEVYFPTLPMTLSGEATLTVVQANTPPSFTKGPDQNVQCSLEPKTVPDWATAIKPHSIPRNVVSYGSDFASGAVHPGPSPWATDFSGGLPAGTISAGTTPPYVGAEGALHLTDQVNGQWNYWTIPAGTPSSGSQTVSAFQAQWKTKLTGVGGADGFSFNMGQDLGTGFPPPEGAANGLSVTVDTYDNGGGEVGCEVKWNGTRLAFVPAGSGTVHGPVELMKDVFVNAAVDVTSSGAVTFTYDNFVVTAQIPGYAGITFNQYAFAAATGGANENCWIDDLSISAAPLTGWASPPPGSQVSGSAYIADGFLRLTDAGNGLYGSFTTPAISTLVDSYDVSFKAAVGGGTCCGDPTTGNPNATADGFSVNIAADLPAPGVAEDGEGTGLSICFDTWDNGGAEAPAIDIKWQGRFLAKYPIQVAQAPAPAVPTFKPVTISVGSAGNVTVTYDGMTIFDNFMLPDYRAQTGLRLGMAARTGGANQAHWIDDLAITAYPLDASSVESGQTVQFIVSNDNPGLFAVQPALSPDGTLTYQSKAGMLGVANVTVVAKDNGGTAYGGNDTSAPQTFVITVRDTIPPFIVCPANMTAECGLPVNYTVTATDACTAPLPVVCLPPSGSVLPTGQTIVTCTAIDTATNAASCSFTVTVVDTRPPQVNCPGNITAEATSDAGAVVNYTATATDPCGLANVNCTPPSGSVFPMGATAVACTATDVAGNVGTCTFTVTVHPANEPPVCATAFPCTWTEAGTTYAIALDNTTACVVLDGSGTTDPDNDPLTFTWIVDGTNTTSGAVVTNCLPTGCHTVTLVVNDGLASSTCERRVCVITAGEAIDQTIALVESTTVARKNKRPLIASLKAAGASFDRGSINSGLNQLKAFQNKVRAQIAKQNPAEAAAFIASAQKIIDAVNCASE